MRKLFVIGIGTGNPEHVTIQAVNALNKVDVFFVMDKGEDKGDLVRARQDICERFIASKTYRFVEAKDPVRDPAAPSYRAGVDQWHRERAAIWERMIAEELTEDGTGGFLVWGDPSLYDSTLRIIGIIVSNGNILFEYQVIPGISSIQALAASHRIALNRIGGSVHITTGRNLSAHRANAHDDVVVMLDNGSAYKSVDAEQTEIYWGAYLGTDKELIVSGPLRKALPEIERLRAEARARNGWIMDTYLLRRRGKDWSG
jgi:precorrin-6A synthase